jgi:hypothetical protein
MDTRCVLSQAATSILCISYVDFIYQTLRIYLYLPLHYIYVSWFFKVTAIIAFVFCYPPPPPLSFSLHPSKGLQN